VLKSKHKLFKVMTMKGKKRTVTGSAAALLGIAMMVFGVYRGEMAEVFTKAVRICLECIGIG
jgi:hypothetical protein